MSVTTTSLRQGKFETRFWHKVFEEEVGRVKGHFGPVNTYVFTSWSTVFATQENGNVALLYILQENAMRQEEKTVLFVFTITMRAISGRDRMGTTSQRIDRFLLSIAESHECAVFNLSRLFCFRAVIFLNSSLLYITVAGRRHFFWLSTSEQSSHAVSLDELHLFNLLTDCFLLWTRALRWYRYKSDDFRD